MSVKEFTLNMPKWDDNPEEDKHTQVTMSRIHAFIKFKKDIINWLKDKKKI